MTYFIRTENGAAANVSKEEGLAEANRCMMDGKREVAEMTAVSDFYDIRYKDGRKVTLSRQSGDMPEPVETADWSGTSTRPSHLHRFQDGKALCNRSIRPRRWLANGEWETSYHTRSQVETGKYAQLYQLCHTCKNA